MQPRTKIIIIILGAFILFGLLVATLFDLFPGKEQPGVSEETPVVLPDRDQGIPEGAVFDSANADEFAAVNPSAGNAPSQGALEREAEDLAVFFLERFGTYSSDARFAYIDDLSGFMTAAYRQELESFKRLSPAREGFYSITADLASIEVESFEPARRSARFNAVMNRTQVSGGTSDAYRQEAVIEMAQSGAGEWLISGVVWGDKR